MKTALPFEYVTAPGPLVPVEFDGQPLLLPEGENLAAALLASGVVALRRSPVSGAPRAPFCMMGACFECLVEVGGISHQACLLSVCADMKIRALDVPASAKHKRGAHG